MSPRGFAAALTLAAAVLAGCAQVETVPEPCPPDAVAPAPTAVPKPAKRPVESPAAPPVRGSVGELLASFGRTSALPLEDFRRELGNAQRDFADDANDANRLRLALLLAGARAPLRDDVRLWRLLEAVEPVAYPTEVHEMLLVLQRLVGDRLRAVRDEQRRGELTLREEQRRSEQRVREEQDRAAELKRKLDALMDLERRMRRDPPGATQ